MQPDNAAIIILLQPHHHGLMWNGDGGIGKRVAHLDALLLVNGGDLAVGITINNKRQQIRLRFDGPRSWRYEAMDCTIIARLQGEDDPHEKAVALIVEIIERAAASGTRFSLFNPPE